MKLSERINYILLGTLWTLTIVLVLDFWLNTAYNFNMFSNAHWQFVAHLQASHRPVSTGFYISITIAIVATIFGLFMLFRPRYRKIIMATPDQSPKPVPIPEPVEKVESKPVPTTAPVQNQTVIQRPPRLHIQMQNRMTPPTPPQTQKVENKPAQNKPAEPRYVHEIRKIFENNNYKVLTPKSISNVPLSLIALGANETLWLGACDISHEQMADVMLAFKNIFKETLDDIEIDINAFIINPTDDDKVDAIFDINSLDELSSAIAEYPNESESDNDETSENLDAFAGYIETVITYLGNK